MRFINKLKRYSDSKEEYLEEVKNEVKLNKESDNLISKSNIEIVGEDILTQQSQLEQLLCKEKSMGEMFKEYYTFSQGSEPKGELMSLFLDIVNEGSDKLDETN